MGSFAVALSWICLALALASLGDAKSFPKRRAPTQGTMIVGGTDARQGQFPYQLELIVDGEHLCGASLVEVDGLQIAVCAAHCVDSRNNYTLVAGEQDLSQVSGVEQTRTVERTVIHPYFGYAVINENDISILFLNESFNLNDNIKAIPLPERREEIEEGNITVSGWGTTSFDGPVPNLLQYINIPVVSNEECKQAWGLVGYGITDHQLCAGRNNGDVDAEESPCNGDSGGPAVSEDGRLAGIVSYGLICDTRFLPAVFTKVSHFVAWIEETVADHKGNATLSSMY